jgi:aspartate/methionine/tyrosine aminotransferase
MTKLATQSKARHADAGWPRPKGRDRPDPRDREDRADDANKTPVINPATGMAKTVTPEDMVNLWFAQNAYVAMNSGSNYGPGGENHIRMNLAASRTTLKAALDSMAGALKKIST